MPAIVPRMPIWAPTIESMRSPTGELPAAWKSRMAWRARAHAVAYALKAARAMPSDQPLVINLSGRGDKDVQEAARLLAERSN